MIRGSIQPGDHPVFHFTQMCSRTVVLVQRERLCYSKKDVYQQLRRADIAENRSVHALRKKE